MRWKKVWDVFKELMIVVQAPTKFNFFEFISYLRFWTKKFFTSISEEY
jgi:hypothetical protein